MFALLPRRRCTHVKATASELTTGMPGWLEYGRVLCASRKWRNRSTQVRRSSWQ
jgi:hypothetical protein